MEHIIAYNPYKNGNKGSVSSQPLSVYDKTIAYPWMADLVAAIRGGNDELKKQLPFRCAHYYQFRDNRRSQKNAVPESFLFQTTIDVDDKEYVDKAIEKARELNCSDTIWNGALLHLEYSARKKLHIDIRMPIGMTIEETQRAYCEALGVPYDESCITPERMLFITDKTSEIYRSPHWYEVLPQEELKKRRQAYLDRGLTIDGRAGKVNSLQLTGNRADEDYPDPPEMPKKLPKLVELLISRTPEIYKPAVAHAIFPPLATHLWKTRFRYIDNVEHEARLMTLLLAGTGAGKSSVNRPIDFIMEDIRLRDAENLKREKAWKDEMLRKGANKDKRKRPENLIIQEIDADMTNPAFVMRTAEAQEHFLYTSLNELDQFDALKGSGSQQFRIMCLASDPGNKYGQTRVGTMSVTERVTIRFNWNASTTIQKGQRYFSKVLTDGPISRINFCTIPEREIGEDMPVYGTYDESYREALRPYIENLNKVTGLIECKEAFQLALKLKDENAEFARLSQDRTFENLSFRANVIAYLKACVLYVANGCKWEPEIDEFIRWSEQYDLYCKMRFFGDMIAKENYTAQRSSKRGPQNLLQILPDNFTAAQLLAIRLEHGLDAKGTDMMIRQWLHRNYIRRAYQYTGKRDSCDSCDSFEKLKYRHDGMVIES